MSGKILSGKDASADVRAKLARDVADMNKDQVDYFIIG
jgi:hypothetical protein